MAQGTLQARTGWSSTFQRISPLMTVVVQRFLPASAGHLRVRQRGGWRKKAVTACQMRFSAFSPSTLSEPDNARFPLFPTAVFQRATPLN